MVSRVTAKAIGPPYSLEQAVTDEQDFWRHIRAIIGEEVHAATTDAVLAMKTVAANQVAVVDRVNGIATQMTAMAVAVTRLENLTTMKSLVDDHLREKLERLLQTLTPESARPTPPGPPVKENGGQNGGSRG